MHLRGLKIKIGGVWRECELDIAEADAARVLRSEPDRNYKQAADFVGVTGKTFVKRAKAAGLEPNALNKWPLETLMKLKGAK